ncbi:PREDICTED: uncharacterized protein LOC108746724 [Trachymyrmex septentrionalis]|uniref:uncharacterized protein LOC108746724 n=1 Tax=Trachymyrmex septentrionalis TaxID=34720 RepID=UPI00084F45BC|nr:PREDICTED: uncharacterized protein LOC108746724 [Trachymyrmex septentrionalis]
MSIDEPTKCIDVTPFELMNLKEETRMKSKEDLAMKKAIEQELTHYYDTTRRQLRDDAKRQIEQIQDENKKYYNLRRRDPHKYHLDDLVAVTF